MCSQNTDLFTRQYTSSPEHLREHLHEETENYYFINHFDATTIQYSVIQ